MLLRSPLKSRSVDLHLGHAKWFRSSSCSLLVTSMRFQSLVSNSCLSRWSCSYFSGTAVPATFAARSMTSSSTAIAVSRRIIASRCSGVSSLITASMKEPCQVLDRSRPCGCKRVGLRASVSFRVQVKIVNWFSAQILSTDSVGPFRSVGRFFDRVRFPVDPIRQCPDLRVVLEVQPGIFQGRAHFLLQERLTIQVD